MYSSSYMMPNSNSVMYRSSSSPSSYSYVQDGDRFFLAPFLVGGLAGTALGYGIANNNQINGRPCCGFYPVYPMTYGQYNQYGQMPNSFSNYNSTNFYY